MSKLTCADIKLGTFLWYSGRTSMGGWNCPAVITRIDEQEKQFYIMSLDDMTEQSQSYAFELTPHSPDSRTSMSLATSEEVDHYLARQEEELIEKVSRTRRVGAQSALTLRRFRAERDKLFPEHVKQ